MSGIIDLAIKQADILGRIADLKNKSAEAHNALFMAIDEFVVLDSAIDNAVISLGAPAPQPAPAPAPEPASDVTKIEG